MTRTLSQRMSVLSMAAPRVDRRAFPACSPSLATQSSVSSTAAGPCKDYAQGLLNLKTVQQPR